MKSGLVAIAIGLIALGLVASLPRAGQAQSPPITATVDRTNLSTDETLTLTVVIHGSGEIPPPSLPHLSEFDVDGRSRSSQISTRNQQTSTEVVYRYTLRPIRPGRATIGAFSVTVNGRTFATDPIEIEVSQGSARPMPRLDSSLRAPSPGFLSGQDYFVEAEVDNSNPYLGQQVVYFFRLYHAEPVSPRTSYVPPGLAGFWSRQEMEPMRFEANVANRRYRVLELRTVLFPTVAGSITIDPASVVIPAGLIRSSEELATEPVGLEVKPLPDGAPKDFDGAVGQFAIRAELDTIAGNVDEPVTLRVVLSGRGNIEALPEPRWPDMPGWRAFDSSATSNADVTGSVLTGSRIYERALIPTTAGDFVVPPVIYVYFDPESSTYQNLATDPIPITIAPGARPAPDDRSPAGDGTGSRAADIRHMKPVPETLGLANRPLTSQVWYWVAWVIPLALLIAAGVWRRRTQAYERDPVRARRLEAFKNAANLLAQAEQGELDPYDTAGRALAGYIGDKLNEPVTGMTREALADLLAMRGVDSRLIQRVSDCLIISDGGRFAPSGGRADADRPMLSDTETLLSDLEKELGA